MGVYNLQDLIEGYRIGKLEIAIEEYDLNDLVFLEKELKEFLIKHNITDCHGLIKMLESKIVKLT